MKMVRDRIAQWKPRGNSVAYHFHAIRILDKSRVLLQGVYRLPNKVIVDIYKPYYADIILSVSRLAMIGVEIRAQAKEPKFRDWAMELKANAIGTVKLAIRKVLRPQWSVNGRTIVKIK